MCLISFAWNAHPEYVLVLAANRDEFHGRPSAPLAQWAEPVVSAQVSLLLSPTDWEIKIVGFRKKAANL